MVAKTKTELREWISSGFTRVEDVAYIALGLILAVSAMGLLGTVTLALGQALLAANLSEKIVGLLDQVLLILMIVEILYTVQVSFREHSLVAEPFLIVGLIAAIRRVLILTAEFSKPAEISEAAFRPASAVPNDEGTIRGTAGRFRHRDVQSSCWPGKGGRRLFVVAWAFLFTRLCLALW